MSHPALLPMPPDNILRAIHGRGGWESLEDNEAAFLYSILKDLPLFSTVVEIGCELGRSSVMIAMVAKDRHFNLHHCDFWVSGSHYAAEWIACMHDIGSPFTLHHMNSSSVDLPEGTVINLLYVDGDHEAAGISADCDHYLHMIPEGGYVAFHDYGRGSLPSVKPTVDNYMVETSWEPLGVSRTMAIWRRK